VAVGTVNFVIKRLVKKGYVRVRQLERRRLKYIITSAGIALRARLAMDALGYSMRLYRETRETSKRLVTQAMRLGFAAVSIRGQGELAEIVRLTCLEMNMGAEPDDEQLSQPVISIVGTVLKLQLPVTGSQSKAQTELDH
jgi:DNA-binding PadR family transcriptional regulator